MANHPRTTAPNARARLLQVLEGKGDDGQRLAIPIFGSGLNEAAGLEDSWDGLLASIRSELGIDANTSEPESQLARWELYLRSLAHAENTQAHKAEQRLQKAVAHNLRQRTVTNESREFYRSILRLQFRDIISLNFEMALDRAGDLVKPRIPSDFKITDSLVPKVRVRPNTSLRRWIDVGIGDNATTTRIWHPHGDILNYRTIRLGTHMYGLYIAELEEARREVAGYQRFFAPRGVETGSHDFVCAQVRDFVHAHPCPSWLAVMFHAPLVIVGTSLRLDEWPMWWALHERARYLNRMKIQRPALFVYSEEDFKTPPARFLGWPAELETVVFASRLEMWDAFLRTQ